jgi:hypothetical protein
VLVGGVLVCYGVYSMYSMSCADASLMQNVNPRGPYTVPLSLRHSSPFLLPPSTSPMTFTGMSASAVTPRRPSMHSAASISPSDPPGVQCTPPPLVVGFRTQGSRVRYLWLPWRSPSRIYMQASSGNWTPTGAVLRQRRVTVRCTDLSGAIE